MGVKARYLSVARFFENGDLVPFAVLTSAWHFIQALRSHGEAWPIAIATGIFVDMLHYRTVRKAVNERSRVAWGVAVLTTIISYIFHLLFYVARLGVDGIVTYDFSVVAFFMALPLPVGIPILAWQQATVTDTAVVKRWRKRVKWTVRIAKRYRNALKEAEIELNRLESQVKSLGTTSQSRESTIENLKAQLEQAKESDEVLKQFNPLVQDIGRMLSGSGMTQAEIATAHEVSEAEVSRLKAKLNGVKA